MSAETFRAKAHAWLSRNRTKEPEHMAEVIPIRADASGDWRDRILYRKTGRGQAIDTVVANAITIIGNDAQWANVLAFDEFSQSIVTTRRPPWGVDDARPDVGAGEWRDEDTIRAQAWLRRTYSLSLGRETVRDAVAVVAVGSVVHPVRDWLDGLTWDKTERVDTWVSVYLGAAESEYASRVGRWMLLGAVARIYAPGAKVDTVPVCEGPQGTLKSTALRVLFGPDWYADTPLDLSSKDRFLGLQGRWCVELAELDSLGRADVDRIKSFLSSATDSYRPPYARGYSKVPRRCVFVGTVNRTDYLRDETGNRRFLPLRCGRIDVDALARDRAQLWAEAVKLYRDGEPWWPKGDETKECAAEQSKRVLVDPWHDLIASKLQATDETTVSVVLSNFLDIELGRHSQAEANRVARVLQLLGFERRRGECDADGRRPWVYRRVPVVPVGAS